MKKNQMSASYITVIAMFAAVSYVLVVISRAIPNVAGFLSYEPKDAMIVIAGLLFGPLSSVLISVIVSFIEMITISSTGFYGFIMNVISTCAFAVLPAWYYQKNRTKKGALIGLCGGVLCMVAVMLLWNYIITPLYMKVDRSVVVGMLATIFLPFNLIKGGINAGLTLVFYKPIVMALRSVKLAKPSGAIGEKGKFSFGFLAFSIAILITFILLFLVMIGKI